MGEVVPVYFEFLAVILGLIIYICHGAVQNVTLIRISDTSLELIPEKFSGKIKKANIFHLHLAILGTQSEEGYRFLRIINMYLSPARQILCETGYCMQGGNISVYIIGKPDLILLTVILEGYDIIKIDHITEQILFVLIHWNTPSYVIRGPACGAFLMTVIS